MINHDETASKGGGDDKGAASAGAGPHGGSLGAMAASGGSFLSVGSSMDGGSGPPGLCAGTLCHI